MVYRLEYYEGSIATSYCQALYEFDKQTIKKIITEDSTSETSILSLFPKPHNISKVNLKLVVLKFDKYFIRLLQSRLLRSPLIKQITLGHYNLCSKKFTNEIRLLLDMMSVNFNMQRFLFTFSWKYGKRQERYDYCEKDLIIQAISNNQLILSDRLILIINQNHICYLYHLILSLSHNHTIRQITINLESETLLTGPSESYQLKLSKIFQLLLLLLRINNHLDDIRFVHQKYNFSISDTSISIKKNSLALTTLLLNRNENKRKKSLSFTEIASQHLTF